jgi:curli biogenesis system outer membrane secretion channel CsgG
MNRLFFLFAFLFLLSGCAVTVEPALMEIELEDTEEVLIPLACGGIYDRSGINVAVVEFLNNTAYQRGQVTTAGGQSQAGIALMPGFIGGSSFRNYESASRYFEPQLGEFAQSAVEGVLVNLGGVNVLSRAHLQQVMNEQQFQMTIADPDTAVNFGRFAGARYIITGSVDSIKVSHSSQVQPVIAGSSDDALIASLIFSAVVLTYNALAAGWNIETELSVNVVDVETAKVVANTRVKGAGNIGTSSTFTLEQLMEGAKEAMGSSLKKIIPMLGEQFKVKGYINELRGGKQIALVSMGSEMGLKEGDKLIPQAVSVQTDFVSKVQKCNVTPLNFTLTVSSSLGNDHAWVQVNTSDKAKLSRLKLGTLVYKSLK